jgi:gamma-aminobutyric acid receptor subunit alpha
LNGRESYLHRIPTSNRLVRLRRDGSVLYSSRLTIKASCPMNLRDFPLDVQTCPLYIGSYGYEMDEVKYIWKSVKDNKNYKAIQIDVGVKLSQFDLLGTKWNTTHPKASNLGNFRHVINSSFSFPFIFSSKFKY